MITNRLLWLWIGLLSIGTLWFYWMAPDTITVSNWQGLVYVLAPTTAVLTGITALHHYGIRSAQGRVLFTLWLGIASWCGGEILWTYYDLVGHVNPYVSLADLFYLIAYLPLSIGFLLEIKFLKQQIKLQFLKLPMILSGIIVLLLLIIAGYFGIYLAYQPEVSLVENLLAITYGLADLVLAICGLVVIVVVSEFGGGKFAKPWWWFLGGIAFIFFADIGFAMFNQPYEAQVGVYKPALDSLWIAGYLAFAYGFNQYAWLIEQVQNKVTTLQTGKEKVG